MNIFPAMAAPLSFNRLGSALVACSIAFALLVGANTAQAAPTVILEGTKVIRIENLEVFDDTGGPEVYDVDFVYSSANNVYGSQSNIDFPQEEDAVFALRAIMNALNINNPRPTAAGSNGTKQFHIGIEFDDGFMATVGGESFTTVGWDECVTDCFLGTAVKKASAPVTYADFKPAGGNPPPSGTVNLSGIVENSGGTPLCAMVLASGQFEFTCDPDGPFSLTNLPRESNGTVKRQVYVDGFFPNVKVLQDSVDETVVMQNAGTCRPYNAPYSPDTRPGSAGKRVDISGSVLVQNSGTPVCAMVLANGQYIFSCGASGSYGLNIPLDNNGQFKLQVYADGFAPSIMTFDEFSLMNDVRLARASECDSGSAPKGVLSITVEEGGRITTEPDVLSCNGNTSGGGTTTCETQVADGTSVRIKAIPYSGWKFDDWDGCDVETSQDDFPICITTITVQAQALIKAEFDPR
jgi:hypothetical protein